MRNGKEPRDTEWFLNVVLVMVLVAVLACIIAKIVLRIMIIRAVG